jgi:hypothetical protein
MKTIIFIYILFFFLPTAVVSQDIPCTFNDDYESLTLQSASHLINVKTVTWSKTDSLAYIVGQNNDKLQLRVGGCYHFGYNLTIKTGQAIDNPQGIIKKLNQYLTSSVNYFVHDILSSPLQKEIAFSELNEGLKTLDLNFEMETHPENLVLHPIIVQIKDHITEINFNWYFN